MDRITGTSGWSELFSKPEILIVYGAFALLVTVFVNWALALLVILLKPFTCAAILIAFFRPDLAQTFFEQERSKQIMENLKTALFTFTDLFLKLGEQFRKRFHL